MSVSAGAFSGRYPMSRRAALGLAMISKPPTVTVPSVAGMNPVIMRMVVDLPAPLGPRKPSTSPRSTPKEMPSTARFAPNVFTRFSILIIGLELRKGGIITQLLAEEKDHEGANWFP